MPDPTAPDLRLEVERLTLANARLSDEARRSYRGDGTYVYLPSPEDVIEQRIASVAEIRRLRAENDRLTLERDAILRWSVRHGKFLGYTYDRVWWAKGDDGLVYSDTAEAVVRKAAGLDPDREISAAPAGCGHGVPDGEYCPECNRGYKLARIENCLDGGDS